MPASLERKNRGGEKSLLLQNREAKGYRLYRRQHRMRRGAQRANLLVAGLRGDVARVYLDAMLCRCRAVNMRRLRRAECREEQRTKEHKAATPLGMNRDQQLRLGLGPG